MKRIVGFYLFQFEGNIAFLHRIMYILPCGKDYFGIFPISTPSYCYWLIKANADKMDAKINVLDTCLHRFVFLYDRVQILCKFFAMYPTQNQLVPWSLSVAIASLSFPPLVQVWAALLLAHSLHASLFLQLPKIPARVFCVPPRYTWISAYAKHHHHHHQNLPISIASSKGTLA